MVQWDNPLLIERLQITNMNIIFLLLGLYGWEYLRSLQIEYAVVRGRLPFRWTLIPYIVGRLFLFLCLLLLAIRISRSPAGISCLPSAMIAAIAGDIGLGCSSANFMIRTWMIWKDNRIVHALLLLFALGHWIVLAFDVANLRPIEVEGGCGVVVVHPQLNAVVFLYALLYDFLVLVLAVVRLSRQSSKSSLVRRLRSQGIAYFAIAVVTSIPPTVFSFIGVTELISISGLSAMTVSTIASYRAVRSLLGLKSSQNSHHSQSTEDSIESENNNNNNIALSTQIQVPAQMTGQMTDTSMMA